MRNRAMLPILVGVLAGGVALYLWYTGQQPKPVEGTIDVVVAAKDIQRLDKVDAAQQFTQKQWPKTAPLPDGAIYMEKRRLKPNEPEQWVFRTVRGGEEVPLMSERSFVTAAFKDSAITVGMLSDPGQAVTATQLKPGMVAVSVNTEEQSSVSGLVKPGSRVNILVTMRVTNPKNNETADICVTALRDVEVFAVGGIIQPREKKEGERPVVARTITLEVTPEQAKVLTLLADRGRITMTLVSAKPGETPEVQRELPMSLDDALEKAGYKQGKEKGPDVKDIRLIDGILKAIANASAAPPVAQPTPGAKGTSELMVTLLPTPTPKPVDVTVYGPNHSIYVKVSFPNYDSTEPTQEYKQGMSPYMPSLPQPPSAPIGSNPPPIAPPVNPPPVQ